MNTVIELSSALAPPLPLLRFSVEQYHQLEELGILPLESKVELLEGWIVRKLNQRPIHGSVVGGLSEWFQQHLPTGFIVRCQLPITTQRSEPEPDIAIIQGLHSDYRDRHPTGIDCRLVIEVSDTSIDKDRAKAIIYQAAGVQEYWIVNVNTKVVERYCFSDSPDLQPSSVRTNSELSIRIGDRDLTLEFRAMLD